MKKQTSKVYIFRKKSPNAKPTCNYPMADGGTKVPKNEIPNLGRNAQEILEKYCVVAADQNGNIHPEWRPD